MLQLSNGHQFTVATAAGALSFGRGYSWEKYVLIPLGIIDPKLFTIITKTITLFPRQGHVRWWRPGVLPFSDGGAINQMGLPNPGLQWLIDQHRQKLFPVNIPTIVSVTPWTVSEGYEIGRQLEKMPEIKGIEINLSCPNTEHKKNNISTVCEIFRAVKSQTRHPVGIKLGYLDLYQEICDILDGEADWFDLINTVPWTYMFPNKKSPLSIWGLKGGGVSGPKICELSREALRNVVNSSTPKQTPIISGGGITTVEEGLIRLRSGARAVTVGTMFLTRPWKVNNLARGIIEGDLLN